MADSLTGRVALVTGGSKGIGRAVALALAEAGADVTICARKMAELEAGAEEIRAKGRRAFATVCDVTAPEQVNRLPAAGRAAARRARPPGAQAWRGGVEGPARRRPHPVPHHRQRHLSRLRGHAHDR